MSAGVTRMDWGKIHICLYFFLFVFWIAYARENVCPSQLSICADHGKSMCFCNTVNSLYALHCAVLLSKIECIVECNCSNHPWPMASACSMPDSKMPHHAHVYPSSCTSSLFFFICLLIKQKITNVEISCLTNRASTKQKMSENGNTSSEKLHNGEECLHHRLVSRNLKEGGVVQELVTECVWEQMVDGDWRGMSVSKCCGVSVWNDCDQLLFWRTWLKV